MADIRSVEHLLAAFEALPTEEQALLELLSVQNMARTTDPIARFALKAELTAPGGKRYSLTALKRLVRKLAAADLLEKGRYRKLKPNKRIVEFITRKVEREGRLERYLQVLYRFDTGQDPQGPSYLVAVRQTHFFRKLRWAAYANDVQRFGELRDAWMRDNHQESLPVDVLKELFTREFDADWIKSRAPEIRDDSLVCLADSAFTTLYPDRALMGLVKELAKDAELPSELYDIAVKHQLLCGDFKGAEELLSKDSSPNGQMFRGWIACVRGQRDAAIACFRNGLRASPDSMTSWFAPFYVFSLIGTGEPACVREGATFIARALTEYKQNKLSKALNAGTDFALGKAERARAKSKSFAPHELVYQGPITELFGTITYCRCSDQALKHASDRISFKAAESEAAGYRWLALEYHRLHRWVNRDGHGRSARDDRRDDLGTVPLMESLVKISQWKAGLSALRSLNPRDFARSTRTRPKSKARLVWLVAVTESGLQLEAREQKMLKSGSWSKGRRIATMRLLEGTNLRCLTDQDWAVCDAIRYELHGYGYEFEDAFAALIGHQNVYRLDAPTTRVEIVQASPEVHVVPDGDAVRIKLVPAPPSSGDTLIAAESTTRISVTVFEDKHHAIFGVVGPKGLRVPAGKSGKIGPAVETVSKLATVQSDVPGIIAAPREVVADATPQFHLTPFAEGLQAVPVVRPFANAGPTFPPGEGRAAVFTHIRGKGARTTRDLKKERRRLDAVVSACRSLEGTSWNGTGWVFERPEDCLELLDELHMLGDSVKLAWPKGEKLKLRHRAGTDRLFLRIRSRTDWFNVSGNVKVDTGLVLTLRKLLDGLERGSGRFVPLKGNEFLALTDQFRQRAEELADILDGRGKSFRLHPGRAFALGAILEDVGRVSSDAAWKGQVKRFRAAQSMEPKVPSTLQAELRGYQVEGFRWAARLATWGAGACLADDMGLGKTLQALAVILARTNSGPSLVIAPTSVCPNWIDETYRFAPTLRPVQFGPGDRKAMLQEAGPFDLVVCSYGLLHYEAENLAAVKWGTIVLDEAQAIKNSETKRWRAAMKLAGGFRMITTGTPIENHLGELHSLFAFINPGLLGTAKAFHQKFAQPIHQYGNQNARNRLKRLIRPFILRRTKAAVLEELPPRTEITLRISMTVEERAFYEAVRQQALESLSAPGGGAGGAAHLKVLAQITKLRRACCHPALVMPESPIASSKLKTFLKTVDDLIASRHKALVFSQFVTHLSIVRSHLDTKGLKYRYLDGSTPVRQRKREIDAFQAGKGDLFLISLRAGGQGLNLTAADYVIHLDPWWNPAVEDQASDRAHRIGQTRPVTIYRLVMKDSIEEKIVDLHRTKRDLADNLLAGTDMTGKMSADELLALLRKN